MDIDAEPQGSEEPAADFPVAGLDRAFWAAVRPEYEDTDEPVALICARLEITQYALKKAVDVLGWRKRRPARADRRDIIMRLFRLLDTQIRILETNMTKAGEAEANVIGKLVASLDKLIALKKASDPAPRRSRAAREMSDIKQRLIERIDQLKRG